MCGEGETTTSCAPGAGSSKVSKTHCWKEVALGSVRSRDEMFGFSFLWVDANHCAVKGNWQSPWIDQTALVEVPACIAAFVCPFIDILRAVWTCRFARSSAQATDREGLTAWV